jgi:hypothetical protein
MTCLSIHHSLVRRERRLQPLFVRLFHSFPFLSPLLLRPLSRAPHEIIHHVYNSTAKSIVRRRRNWLEASNTNVSRLWVYAFHNDDGMRCFRRRKVLLTRCSAAEDWRNSTPIPHYEKSSVQHSRSPHSLVHPRSLHLVSKYQEFPVGSERPLWVPRAGPWYSLEMSKL